MTKLAATPQPFLEEKMIVRFTSWDHLMKLRRTVGALYAHGFFIWIKTAANYRITNIVILQPRYPTEESSI